MKCHGAGPLQNHISPLKAKFMGQGYDHCGLRSPSRTVRPPSIATPRGILRRVTIPSPAELTDELLIVAIVEMAPGHAEAGRRYEDAVLALLDRHGASVERRMRSADSAVEVHVIRFRSRAGYESFMVDPDRLAHREELGDAAPSTRVLELHDVDQ